jgi:molybdate transport system substrate-binding protein
VTVSLTNAEYSDNVNHSRKLQLSRFTVLALALCTVAIAALLMAMERSRREEPNAAADAKLIVFAASSLTDAMQELSDAFERANPSVRINVNFAASSRLALQIREGMPADVFVSAGWGPMRTAEQSGRVPSSSVTVIARNHLVLIAPADNPAGVREFTDIGTKRIALTVAAPGVPAREYTEQMVQRVIATSEFTDAFRDRYERNIASEENNVRQVAARVALGEADAGVVYATDVTPEIRKRIVEFPAPAAYRVAAEYPVATLRGSQNLDTARAFGDFLRSAEAGVILSHHGFTPAAALEAEEQR